MKKSQLKDLIREIIGEIKRPTKINEIRSIFAEAVKEVFEEGIKPGTEKEIHGILGFPFDKYIVRGSVQIETPDDESSSSTTYKWKLLIPVDDPELIKNLDEAQETFEEKITETITKRVRSETAPGGQYSTGHADIEDRIEKDGKKYLLVQVEMMIGWDV